MELKGDGAGRLLSIGNVMVPTVGRQPTRENERSLAWDPLISFYGEHLLHMASYEYESDSRLPLGGAAPGCQAPGPRLQRGGAPKEAKGMPGSIHGQA